RRPGGDMEHLGVRQLADHLRSRSGRDLQSRPGGPPLMSEPLAKLGMAPPHPGSFIRDEILNELHLPIARAAEILGVRRATLSDLVNGHAALSPEMALRIE